MIPNDDTRRKQPLDPSDFRIKTQADTGLYTVEIGGTTTKNLTRQQMLDMVNGWVKPS